MEKPPKYAVVVVHGIGPGTGDTRREFSAILKENVRKAMIPSDSDIVWKEAEWEGVNDNIDAIARRVLSELCSRYINDVQYSTSWTIMVINPVNAGNGFGELLAICFLRPRGQSSIFSWGCLKRQNSISRTLSMRQLTCRSICKIPSRTRFGI